MDRREKEQLLARLVGLGDAIRDVPHGKVADTLVQQFFGLIRFLQAEDLVAKDLAWNLKPRK